LQQLLQGNKVKIKPLKSMALSKTLPKNNDIRNTVLVSLGTALAYYDFAVFGMMAKYLADTLFASIHVDSAIIFVYLMFSMAYFARPIGGLIFGLIGDRFGRKLSLLLVTLTMLIATFAIGLLPNNQSMGILAGIFLAILRLLQGLAYGAELPGVLVFVSERTSISKMAFQCSIVMAVTGLGTVLSTLILYLMSSTLDYNAIVAWGWRLPFILGGILAVINYYFRLKIVEEIRVKPQHNIFFPLKDLLTNHSCAIVFGILLTSFFACLLLMDIYFITYFADNYAYKTQDIYFARSISRTLSSFLFILFGLLTDRLGSIKIITYTLCAFIVSIAIYVIFDPLDSGKVSSLTICLCLHEALFVAYAAAFIPLIINFFDPQVRFTGFAMCYNFGFALLGFLPKAFSHMIIEYDEPLIIFIVPIILAILVLMTITLAIHYPKNFKLRYDQCSC
jgi:MFS family permease